MKKLLLASTITVLTLTSAFVAPAAQASNIAQNVCEFVAADDKKRMRSYLKSNKLKIRSIFDGVQCNGQNLLEFAANRGSVKTGSLMISKLPKKTVSANLAVIQSGTPLFDAANKRVSS
ncbi:DUF3718 domain-containing protein [Thalassotalea eurytherma]|uniref:DUF3718 domain-containing protein n=1 Tax=Thalassotalea eurytherma TaxID=1144278 RepID=A0ABQ6GY98_9GAMM|nr:DUF3718 domain-containing protein [Thalassotalea eurytherma]GLX80832.1 hypothetical protein theurythT_02840 [Thalassotalea eurytherma]